jgi:hypothetical protein
MTFGTKVYKTKVKKIHNVKDSPALAMKVRRESRRTAPLILNTGH